MLQIFFLKKWIITLKYYSIFSIVWPMMITELYNMKNAHLIKLLNSVAKKKCRVDSKMLGQEVDKHDGRPFLLGALTEKTGQA